MFKRSLPNILIFVVSLLLSFVIAELAVRRIGSFDEIGQFYFQGRPIPPFTIPTEQTRGIIEDYLKNEKKAFLIYDPQLGWSPRSNYSNKQKNIFINSNGVRSNREYPITPDDNTLRIALFGDSYTFDAEVGNNETWSQALEESLLNQNINAEVINFGVNGYGMDQAYLRWKILGQEYRPDIVIFGLVLKDAQRNVNVFRQILNPTSSIPFTKPRFVLADGQLKLVNSPTVPINKIADTLANLHNSELSQYEAYYDSRYAQKWWLNSKFFALIKETLGGGENQPNPDSNYIPQNGNEHVAITRAIIQQFSEDVRADGSQFMIVYLPDPQTHRSLDLSDLFPYVEVYKLLPELEEQYIYYNIEEAFVDDGGFQFPANGQSHYNPSMNRKIGAYLAQEIVECIDNNLCTFTRFEQPSFDQRK